MVEEASQFFCISTQVCQDLLMRMNNEQCHPMSPPQGVGSPLSAFPLWLSVAGARDGAARTLIEKVE